MVSTTSIELYIRRLSFTNQKLLSAGFTLKSSVSGEIDNGINTRDTCLCGISEKVLDDIELLIQQARKSGCSLNDDGQTRPEMPTSLPTTSQEDSTEEDIKPSSQSLAESTELGSRPQVFEVPSGRPSSAQQSGHAYQPGTSGSPSGSIANQGRPSDDSRPSSVEYGQETPDTNSNLGVTAANFKPSSSRPTDGYLPMISWPELINPSSDIGKNNVDINQNNRPNNPTSAYAGNKPVRPSNEDALNQISSFFGFNPFRPAKDPQYIGNEPGVQSLTSKKPQAEDESEHKPFDGSVVGESFGSNFNPYRPTVENLGDSSNGPTNNVFNPYKPQSSYRPTGSINQPQSSNNYGYGLAETPQVTSKPDQAVEPAAETTPSNIEAKPSDFNNAVNPVNPGDNQAKPASLSVPQSSGINGYRPNPNSGIWPFNNGFDPAGSTNELPAVSIGYDQQDSKKPSSSNGWNNFRPMFEYSQPTSSRPSENPWFANMGSNRAPSRLPMSNSGYNPSQLESRDPSAPGDSNMRPPVGPFEPTTTQFGGSPWPWSGEFRPSQAPSSSTGNKPALPTEKGEASDTQPNNSKHTDLTESTSSGSPQTTQMEPNTVPYQTNKLPMNQNTRPTGAQVQPVNPPGPSVPGNEDPSEKPPMSESTFTFQRPVSEADQIGSSGPPVTVQQSSNLPPGTSYLQGLVPPPESNNQALMKLNKTVKVDPSDIQGALQSTVPEVVSNIFSNLNNLVEKEQQKPGSANTGAVGTLTSIDGSSVNVQGDSSAQIVSEGEKIFQEWIEHQLNNLHLTASVANYIRKNAINLFRRVLKQYVDQVSKLSGSIEENVRKATQTALSNTQHLTSFILRNYINFAGGLLRVIGEQVSRVGKNLDTTGNVISNMNLNPFDIMSNVLQSLPNPTDYADYFRSFGRYLMGQGPSPQRPQDHRPVAAEVQDQEVPAAEEEPRRRGILSNTVGALQKAFGSWFG